MLRQEAIEAIADGRQNTISVATMQASSPWHDVGQGEIDHLDASRCMGSASSLALGLALAKPDRKVIVLDGDGSLLMQLGSLVTIAQARPSNFYHFIFANGVHESTGNQPIPGRGITNVCQMALGAGYNRALNIETKEKLTRMLPELLGLEGPVLINLAIDVEPGRKTRFPGTPMSDQIQSLRRSLAGV